MLKSKWPGSLIRPKKKQSTTITKKRQFTAAKLKNARDWRSMARHRGIKEYDLLFASIGIPPLQKLIKDKIIQKGSCQVFEIGSGHGNTLRELRSTVNPKEGNLSLTGMDAYSFPSIVHTYSKKKSYEIADVNSIHGNILTKPFPKSDIIISLWTLGYVGHFGYVAKKVGDALNPTGCAILHINARGTFPRYSDLVSADSMLKDNFKTAKQLEKIKIPNCTIKTLTNLSIGGARDAYRDIVVVIIKN